MNTRPQDALPYLDLARQAARITRRIGLDELSRLEDLIVENVVGPPDASLDVSLQFGLTPEGVVRVEGEIRGEIGLICHGCAEALPYRLDLSFDCLIVGSEGAASRLDAQVAAGAHPEAVIVAQDREVGLADIVEDEILLSLPERLCRTEPCPRAPRLVYPAGGQQNEASSGVEEASVKENPFSVLAELTKEKFPGSD